MHACMRMRNPDYNDQLTFKGFSNSLSSESKTKNPFDERFNVRWQESHAYINLCAREKEKEIVKSFLFV